MWPKLQICSALDCLFHIQFIVFDATRDISFFATLFALNFNRHSHMHERDFISNGGGNNAVHFFFRCCSLEYISIIIFESVPNKNFR